MRPCVVGVISLLLWNASSSAAQCPTGTPPPCEAPRPAVALRPVPAPVARARRLLFLPFRNVTQGAAQNWLVTGAPLMLAEALGQFHDLTVVPEERLTAARRRLSLSADSPLDASQLQRLAQETDGWTAVSGNVFLAGGRLRISVQALDIPTSRVIVRGEELVALDADVREAFDRLSVRLLEPTGLRSAPLDLAALTTQSVDAYRSYVSGIEYTHTSSFRQARDAFAEAVRLDSTFALAWAKLALASIAWNELSLFTPTGPAAHAVEQAARTAARLPPRQAQLVRAWQLLIRSQGAAGRRIGDSLAVTDPDDLDAREFLAIAETLDMILDTGAGPPRPAASLNSAVARAREVLDRDPGRRYLFAILAYAYGVGGGLWGGDIPGWRSENGGSLALMMLHGPDVSLVPVLRDSIVLVVRDSFNALPGPERIRLRRRASDAAMTWVNRWLAAGPTDGEAHLWASRIAELQDDFPRALREVSLAESLGVQTRIENVTGRRLALLVKTGQYQTAGALADSLFVVGSLPQKPFDHGLDRSRAYGAAALLLTRRWARVADLGNAMGPPSAGRPSCASVQDELAWVQVTASTSVLRAVMDTIAMHFGDASGVEPLTRCLENLSTTLTYDSATAKRGDAATALLHAADSLSLAGNSAQAYRAARAAWVADTVQDSAIASSREWFRERSRSLALGHNFMPDAAVVEADSAVFAFKFLHNDSLFVDSPGLATNWQLRVNLRASSGKDTVYFGVSLTHASPPTQSGAVGGPTQLIAAIQNKGAYFSPRAIAGADSVKPSIVTLAQTSEGFNVVVRGTFVSMMQSKRPATAQYFSSPCIAVTDGLCGRPLPSIAVVYR